MDINRIRPLQALACIMGSLMGLSGAVAGTTLQSRRVASGLTRPVGVYAAPGDSQRLFIVEKRE